MDKRPSLKVKVDVQLVRMALKFPCHLTFSLQYNLNRLSSDALYELVNGECLTFQPQSEQSFPHMLGQQNQGLLFQFEVTEALSTCMLLVFVVSKNGQLLGGTATFDLLEGNIKQYNTTQSIRILKLQKCPDKYAEAFLKISVTQNKSTPIIEKTNLVRQSFQSDFSQSQQIKVPKSTSFLQSQFHRRSRQLSLSDAKWTGMQLEQDVSIIKQQMDQSARTVRKYKTQINELEKQMQQAKIMEMQNNSRNKEAELQIKELITQLQSKNKEIQTKNKELMQLEIKLKEKNGESGEKSKEIEHRTKYIEIKEKELKDKSQELAYKQIQLNKKNTELEQRVRQVEKKNIQLKEKTQELEQKSFELKQREMEIKQKNEVLQDKNSELVEKKKELVEKDRELEQKSRQLRLNNSQLVDRELEQKSRQIKEKNQEIQKKDRELEQKNKETQSKDKELQNKDRYLQGRNGYLDQIRRELEGRNRELEQMSRELEARSRELEQIRRQLEGKNRELGEKSKELANKNRELLQMSREIENRDRELKQRSRDLLERSMQLEKKGIELEQRGRALQSKDRELCNYRAIISEQAEKTALDNEQLSEKDKALQIFMKEGREAYAQYELTVNELKKEYSMAFHSYEVKRNVQVQSYDTIIASMKAVMKDLKEKANSERMDGIKKDRKIIELTKALKECYQAWQTEWIDLNQ